MDDKKISSCVGYVVLAAVSVVVTAITDGWALSTIWNWFIPPIFHLTSLTLMQAIGVAMVFSLFTRTNSLKKSNDNEYEGVMAVVYVVFSGVFTALFSVGIAWVILQFAF